MSSNHLILCHPLLLPPSIYPSIRVFSNEPVFRIKWPKYWSPQQRCGSVVACCRIGGAECSSACMGPFEGGCHYLHYLHHSLASSQTTRREQPRPSTENWMKNLWSIAPTIRTRPSFPLSQSLPSGNFHKLLILTHQRADKMKIAITEN